MPLSALSIGRVILCIKTEYSVLHPVIAFIRRAAGPADGLSLQESWPMLQYRNQASSCIGEAKLDGMRMHFLTSLFGSASGRNLAAGLHPQLRRMLAAALLLVTLIIPVQARTWYASSSSGNDGNDGLSPATPYRTITKINAVPLQAGDTVLFKRGDVFSGELSARSGSTGRPIVYGAYGNGDRPIIDGSIRIASTGWTVYRGSIMMKSGVNMPAMTDAEPPSLFFNGTTMLTARHPDAGFMLAQTVGGGNPGSHCCEYSISFSDSALGAAFGTAGDLEGGLVTAYDPYGVSTRRIRSYDPAGGTISIDTLRGVAFIGHKLYFLSAKAAFLDKAGEWYYDEFSKQLYAWFPEGAQPAAKDTISYSNILYGINAWQIDDVVVRDIEFRRQQIAGVLLVRSDRFTIENCLMQETKHGVILWGSTGPPEIRMRDVRIENNSFLRTFRTGINSRTLEECSISRNTFRDIGMINAFGQSGAADKWGGYGYWEYGIGIQASGINSLIEYNRLFNTGRQAIAAGGPGVSVRFNVVDSSCLNYNDCGGIMPLGWSRTESNIIRNSIGPVEQYRSTGARGIYPDFRVEDTIRYNTVINTRVGIGLTNSKDEVVSNNTIYGSLESQFRMNKKNVQPLNNRITGNIFFGLDASQHSVNWENQIMEADASFLDSNRYWNPYVTFPIIKFKKDSASSEGWYDLASWKTTGRDLHSTREFVAYASPYEVLDTTGNNLIANGTFDNNASGWTFPDSLTIVAGVLDGNCVRLKKNSSGGKLFRTILTKPLDASRTYLVRFTVADPSNIGRVNLRIRQDGGTYESSLDRWYLTKSTRREYWTVFRPVLSSPVRMEFLSSNSVYWLDNIALFEVETRYVEPETAFPIFVNDTDELVHIPLGERCYLDLDSNVVTTSLALPPFSSKILIARDSCATTGLTPAATQSTMSLEVYPNPSRDGRLQIRISAGVSRAARIIIYDALGRTIRKITECPEYGTFAIQGLHSGRYLVVLISADAKVWSTATVLE